MKPSNAFILVIVTILFVASLWLVDVSVSAMINEGVVVSLFGISTPVVTYHIGLVLATSMYMVGISWLLFIIEFKEKKCEE